MKKIIVFLFIFISAFAYAQDSTQIKSKKTKHFFVGVNFSSDLCYRYLKNISGNQSFVDMYNKMEVVKFGYTTGINVCYYLKKRAYIEAGVQYSNNGFQNKTDGLSFGDPIDRRRGFVYNTNPNNAKIPTSGKLVYNYNYLDIPLKTNFTFGKKRTQLIAGVGLTTSILLRATNSFIGKYSDGSSFRNSSNTTSEYNRINLFPLISCGIQYKVNDKIFFKIEPMFRYGILKMVNAPVTQYLWNAGLNLSWYFI